MPDDMFDLKLPLAQPQEVRRLAKPKALHMRVALGTIKLGAGVEFPLSLSTDGMVFYIDTPDKREWVLNLQAQISEALGLIVETLPEETKALCMIGAKEPN